MESEDQYKLPVDYPKTAAVAGFIYEHVFEPINRMIAWFESRIYSVKIKDETEAE
jgi:hypothetical protein